MKKVFVKRIMDGLDCFPLGFEAEVVDGIVNSKKGSRHNIRDFFDPSRWQRIERECFEHGGEVWYRHTPGDPMPCDGYEKIEYIMEGMVATSPASACALRWTKNGNDADIIGWRFADSAAIAKIEPVGGGVADDTAAIKQTAVGQKLSSRTHPPGCTYCAWCGFKSAAEPDIAAIEDSSLSPAQRKHWEQMEAKQAAKERLQRDAEAKALQERAKQLSDAGNAMDRVSQDHGHKFGAMQCTHHGK